MDREARPDLEQEFLFATSCRQLGQNELDLDLLLGQENLPTQLRLLFAQFRVGRRLKLVAHHRLANLEQEQESELELLPEPVERFHNLEFDLATARRSSLHPVAALPLPPFGQLQPADRSRAKCQAPGLDRGSSPNLAAGRLRTKTW